MKTFLSQHTHQFHPDMPEMKNIPIGTVVTAIDLAHLHDTVILVFHEALYFGNGRD
jgi:hypothetical protein